MNRKTSLEDSEQNINKIKWLADHHPLTFSLAISFLFILILVISALASALWTGEGYGNPGGTIVRVISIAFLLALLSYLGWLRPAGFTRLGRLQTWLALILPLAYAVAVSAYAFMGNFDLSYSDPELTVPVFLFIVAAATLEEITFRGLIMYGLARAWGSTNRGLLASVLVSSLFFGG
ncbi:MAG: CPBP family intramembrane metalloprotease, partial [Chloroflexi bacterium]